MTLQKYTGVTTADHDGEAEFRRYDDGWRVESVTFGDIFGGGNPRTLKEDILKPLQLIGTFKGTITGPTGSRPLFAQVLRDADPNKAFGFFTFENPTGPRVMEKFDGTWYAASSRLVVVDRIEGATYSLILAGDWLKGESRGDRIELTRQPPSGYGTGFFTKEEWDKAYGPS